MSKIQWSMNSAQALASEDTSCTGHKIEEWKKKTCFWEKTPWNLIFTGAWCCCILETLRRALVPIRNCHLSDQTWHRLFPKQKKALTRFNMELLSLLCRLVPSGGKALLGGTIAQLQVAHNPKRAILQSIHLLSNPYCWEVQKADCQLQCHKFFTTPPCFAFEDFHSSLLSKW